MALVAALAAPAHAQERLSELTLDRAMQLALGANADLAAAEDRVRSLRASAAQAGALPNPTLDVRREDHGSADAVNIAALSQKIEISGARGARRRAAAQDAEAAEWGLRQARSRLQSEVRSRFAEVLAAQQLVQLAEEDATLADTVAQAVGKRVTAGKVSPIEETRARLITGSARIEREQAQRDLATARADLLALWSNTQDFDRAAGSLEPDAGLPAWPDLESRIEKLPAILQADADVAAQRARLDLERARRIPDPSIAGAVRRYPQRDEDSYDFGISVPLPLFDRNSHAVESASAALDEITAKRRSSLARLRAELQTAYQRATAATSEAELLDRDLKPAAQSAFEATRTGYELGKFNLLELLDAQRAYQQVRQQHLRAHLDAATARAELDRLIDAGNGAGRP